MATDYVECDYYLTGEDHARFECAGGNYLGQPRLGDILRQQLLALLHEDAAASYGLALFEALLPNGSLLHTGYREALALARNQDRRLRFRLHVDAPPALNLHGLHWELLADPKERLALSRAREIAFSRHANLGVPPPPPIKTRPRLLVITSNPSDIEGKFGLPLLNRVQMQAKLQAAMEPLDGLVDVVFLEPPTTISRISERLVGEEFHAIHFLGHGAKNSSRAALILEQEDGKGVFVDEDVFSQMIQGIRTLRLLTLIACHAGEQLSEDPFSGIGPALVERGIPAVIAMRQAISMEMAQVFTRHFYLNLSRTGHVDVAANEARQQVYLNFPESGEWGTPALFMRLADARIWEPPAQSPTFIRATTSTPIPWEGIRQNLKRGKVVPIIGSEITRGLLLSPRNIAQRWAADWKERLKQEGKVFPFTKNQDLPSVAKYIDIVTRAPYLVHNELLELLKENLIDLEDVKNHAMMKELSLNEVIKIVAHRHFEHDDSQPHRLLAELPVTTYLTTSHDSFMSEALAWKRKKVQRVLCHWKEAAEKDYPDHRQYMNLKGVQDNPLVFHLYGCDEPESMVVTEDDYLDFLRKVSRDLWRIPNLVRSTLADSILLFLGFDITDLDFRILWKSIIQELKETEFTRRGRIIVLQINLDEGSSALEGALRDFQEQCCSTINLTVYPGNVRQFLKELSMVNPAISLGG